MQLEIECQLPRVVWSAFERSLAVITSGLYVAKAIGVANLYSKGGRFPKQIR